MFWTLQEIFHSRKTNHQLNNTLAGSEFEDNSDTQSILGERPTNITYVRYWRAAIMIRTTHRFNEKNSTTIYKAYGERNRHFRSTLRFGAEKEIASKLIEENLRTKIPSSYALIKQRHFVTPHSKTQSTCLLSLWWLKLNRIPYKWDLNSKRMPSHFGSSCNQISYKWNLFATELNSFATFTALCKNQTSQTSDPSLHHLGAPLLPTHTPLTVHQRKMGRGEGVKGEFRVLPPPMAAMCLGHLTVDEC